MKVFAKKSLATFLAIMMVLSVCPLWLFGVTASAQADNPTKAEDLDPRGDVATVEDTAWEYPYCLDYSNNVLPNPTADDYPFKTIVDGETATKAADWIRVPIDGTEFEYVIAVYGQSVVNRKNAILVRRKPEATDSSATYVIPSDFVFEYGEEGQEKEKVEITKLYFGEGVTGIANCTSSRGPFFDQTTLTDVFFGDDFRSIGDYAFYNNVLLENATLSKVTHVGKYAFDGTMLNQSRNNKKMLIGTSAAVGSSSISIDERAFQNLTGYKKMQIGSQNTSSISVGTQAFGYHTALTELVFGNNASVTLGSNAFYDATHLDTLRLGKINNIGSQAFRYAYNVGKTDGYLDLRGTVTIGDGAFRDCYTTSNGYNNLRKVIIDGSLVTISQYAFANDQMLSSFNFEDAVNLTSIGTGAFCGNAMTDIFIPAKVATIGGSAFGRSVSGVTSGPQVIKSLTFAEDSVLTSMGTYAFYNQKLPSVVLPSHLTSIGAYAFASQAGLSSVTVNGGAAKITIGNNCFASSGVTTVVLNGSKISLGANAFHSDFVSSLTINVTDELSIGDSCFYNNRDLEKIVIPTNVVTIGANAFSTQYTRLSPSARYQTLKEVEFRSTKINVGQSAFANQINLEKVSMMYIANAANLTLGYKAFGHTQEDAYFITQEYDVYDSNNQPDTVTATVGLSLFLNEQNISGPIHQKFINEYNYYAGSNVQIVLKSAKYPTCTDKGVFLYDFIINYGQEDEKHAEIRNTVDALGHKFNDGTLADPNCVYGNHYEQYCVRGCVHPDFGVDADGYAYGIAFTANSVAVPAEDVVTKMTLTKNSVENNVVLNNGQYFIEGSSTPLGEDDVLRIVFKYYLASDESVECTASPVQKDHVNAYGLAVDADGDEIGDRCSGTNFVEVGGIPLGHHFSIGYNLPSSGVLEPAVLSSALVAEWNETDKVFTFNSDIIYDNGSRINYASYNGASAFTGFKPIELVFVCDRFNHMNTNRTTDTLESRITGLFIPTTLQGMSDQKLADINLGVSNLSWKDENQLLAGEGGVRYFTAVYTPTGYSVAGEYEDVEIQIPIYVTRVEMSLEDVTFINTKQSTAKHPDYDHVTAENVPENLIPSSALEIFIKDSVETAFADLPDTAYEGKVRLGFTYYSDVYDFAEDGGNVKTHAGYTFIEGSEVEVDGRKIKTIWLETDFALKPPSLDLVEATGDSVVYNGEGHGFKLTNLPAGTKVTVTQITVANSSGTPVANGYFNEWTESAAESGKTPLNDLRTVVITSSAITDAGKYCFRIDLENTVVNAGTGDPYYSNETTTLYVETNISKAVVQIPASGISYTYNGTVQTGFAVPSGAHYTVVGAGSSSILSAKNAGTYHVEVALESQNYVWSDNGTANKSVNWQIRKLTVQIPTVGENVLTYNGERQTPLNWMSVNIAEDESSAVFGQYKIVVDPDDYAADTVATYIYLNDGEWHQVYVISNAMKKNVGSAYNLDTAISKFLTDSENYAWPTQDLNAPVYGTWAIVKAEVSTPTLEVENTTYTGSAADIHPTLGGSWDSQAFAFDKTGFDINSRIRYYTNFVSLVDSSANVLTGPTNGGAATEGGIPSKVGRYVAVVDLSDIVDNDNCIIANPVATCVFRINKQVIDLYDATEEKDYNGKDQAVPLPKVFPADSVTGYEKDGAVISPEAYALLSASEQDQYTPVIEAVYGTLPSGVVFSYYTPLTENNIVKTDDDGHYIPAGDAMTSFTGKNIGTYKVLVAIAESCENYESSSYALCTLIILKTDQSIVVEQNGVEVPEHTDDMKTWTVRPALGDAPTVVRLRGTDAAAALSVIDSNSAARNSGTITFCDGGISIYLAANSEGGVDATISVNKICSTAITVNADATTNGNACTGTLVIDVAKANPAVSAVISDKIYDGAAAAISAKVDGVKLNGGTGAYILPTGTDASSHIAESTFITYTYYNNADLAEEHRLSAAPTDVGTYYVTATYAGDGNYNATTSAASQYEIKKAGLAISLASAIDRNYNGTSEQAITITDVKGVGNASVTGYDVKYMLSATQPAADAEGWTSTAPMVLNVASSGIYWVRVELDNYDVAIKSSAVNIKPVKLDVSAGNISLTKNYDGNNTVFATNGASTWTAAIGSSAADAAIIAAEIQKFTVTATYNTKNAGSNYAVTVVYTLVFNDGTNGSAENYGNYQIKYPDMSAYATLSAGHTDTATYVSSGVINKKIISVSGIEALDRQYDGSTKVGLSGAIIIHDGDLIAGDTVEYVLNPNYVGILSSATVGNGKAVVKYAQTTGSDVSDLNQLFSATPATATAAQNYTVATVNYPTADISKRELTITLADQEKTYTGSEVTGYQNANVAVKAIMANDSLGSDLTNLKNSGLTYTFYTDSACTSAFSGTPTNAGTYYVKVTLNENASYTAEPVSAKLTIKKAAALTASFDADKLTWTYDGRGHELRQMLSDVKNSNNLSIAADSYSVIFRKNNESGDVALNVKDVSESGTYWYKISSDNYEDTVGTITVTVNKRVLDISYSGLVTEKTYDGTRTAAITSAAVANTVESLSVTAVPEATYDLATIGAAKISITYTVTLDTADFAENYQYVTSTNTTPRDFTVTSTAVLAAEDVTAGVKINTRKIGISSGIAADSARIFDGTADISLSGTPATTDACAIADGLTFALVTGAKGTADSANAGTGRTVSINADQVSITGGTNYTCYEIESVDSVSVDIAKKDPVPEWVGSLVAGYSKKAVEATYYYAKFVGVGSAAIAENDDTDITYTFYSDNTYSSTISTPVNQGTYYVKAAYAGNGNYNSSAILGTLTISETGIYAGGTQITSNDRTYNGLAQPVISSAVVYSDLYVDDDSTKGHIDISEDNAAKIYLAPYTAGSSRPADDSSDWKLAWGYDASGLITSGLLTVTDAGTYTYWLKITATSHENCYNFGGSNSDKVTVTVTPATLTAEVTVTTEKTYDGNTVATTSAVTVNGIQNNEAVTAVASSAFGGKDATTNGTITTTYVFSFGTGAKASNYTVNVNGFTVKKDATTTVTHSVLADSTANEYKTTVTGKINRKEITVYNVGVTTRQYNGSTAVALVALTGGIKSNDIITGDTVGFTITSNYTANAANASKGTRDVTIQPATGSEFADIIAITGADNVNYKVSSVKGATASSAVQVVITERDVKLQFGSNVKQTGTGADKANAVVLNDVAYDNTQGLQLADYAATAALKENKEGDAANLATILGSEAISYSFYLEDGTTPVTENSGIPQSAGTYYVKAGRTASDFTAAEIWGKITITKGELSVTHANISHVYNSVADNVVGSSSTGFTAVTGVNSEDLRNDYSVVIYKVSGSTVSETVVKEWFATASGTQVTTVRNVADSGTYYYKVSVDNYEDKYGCFTVSITKKDVTVASSGITTGTAGSMVYTGLNSVVLSGTTLTPTTAEGFCSDDIANITLTLKANSKGTLANVNVGNDKAVSIAASCIEMGGSEAGNYNIASVENHKVNVTPADPTLTFPTDSSAVYTGSAIVSGKYTVTVTGVNNESGASKLPGTVSYSFKKTSDSVFSATVPTDVGEYDVRATYTAGAGDNYATYYADSKISITKAALAAEDITVTGYTGEYNGLDNDAITAVSVSDLNGDTYTSAASSAISSFTYYRAGGAGTATTGIKAAFDAYAGAKVDAQGADATVKDVAESGVYYYCIVVDNYDPFYGYFTVSISKATLVITDNMNTTKIYDSTKTVNPISGTALVATVNGIKNNEDITATVTAEYADKNAGTKGISVTYDVTFGTGADEGNYQYKFGSTGTAADLPAAVSGVCELEKTGVIGTINKKALEITGITAEDKIYDGTAAATAVNSTAVLSGAISSDAISLVAGTAKFADANAAENKTVSFENYGITGNDAANYQLQGQPADVTADIARKNIASAAISFIDDYKYTGVEQTRTVTSVIIDGLDVTYTVSGTTNKGTEAGSYNLVINGTGNFTGTAEKEWNIAKVDLTITVQSQKHTYDGAEPWTGRTQNSTEDSYWKITTGALVNSEAKSVLNVVLTKEAGTDVGTYDVTGDYDNDNYNVTFANETDSFEIQKRAITITPDAKTKTYGDADPERTFTVTTGSLVSGEALTGVTINRTEGETVGIYTYTIVSSSANASNTNYNISVATNTLEITKRAIEITIGDQEHEYNKAEPWTNNVQTSSSATYWAVTSGAIQNNERVSDDKSSLNVVLTKAAGINVGEYDITGAYSNGNYTVSFVTGTYEITPREITVEIGDASKNYGETPDISAVTLTAKKAGAADSVAQSEIAVIRAALENFKINASSFSPVGEYDISADDKTYGNYKVTTVNGTYTVTKRPVTITVTHLEKFYDQDVAEFAYAITSGTLANNDTIDVTLSSAIAKSTPVGSEAINVTEYVISSSSTETTSNYEVTVVNSDYTVKPARFTYGFNLGNGTKATTFGVDYQNTLFFTNTDSGRSMTAENGNEFDGTVTWSVDSTAIATVSSTGVVTPVATGIVRVTATLADSTNYEIITPSVYYDLAIAAAGNISAGATPYTGYQQLTDDKIDGQFKDITLVEVEIVNPTGEYPLTVEYSVNSGAWTETVPTTKSSGIYVIKVRITDPADHYGIFETTVTANVYERTTHNVNFGANGGTFTEGSSAIVLTDGIYLTADVFPTVSYTGRSFTGWKNLMTGVVKTAEEWAADSIEVSSSLFFEAQWSNENITVELVDDDFTYTGSPIFPEIIVKVGNTVLSSAIDYTAYYSNNLNAGTGKITVICNGAYAGLTGSVTFTIKKAHQKILIENGMGSSGIMILGDTTAVMAMGLIDNPAVTYTSSNTSVITVSSSGVVRTLTAGESTVAITVADTANVYGYVYEINVTVKEDSGDEFDPQISNDQGLEPGTYIKVTESNKNKNAQDYGVRNATKYYASEAALIYGSMTEDELKALVGEGNFVYDLDIGLYDRNDVRITDYRGVYTVKILLPEDLRKATNVQVTFIDADGGVEVMESARYGNYLVFKTTHFSSFQVYTFRDIADPDVSVEIQSSAVYTGDSIVLVPTVTDIIGSTAVTLTADVDYKVVYSDNIKAGTATVTIIGLGEYGGYRTETFEILKADNEWNGAGTPDAIQDWTYGDPADTPSLTSKFGNVIFTYSVKGETTSSAVVPTDAGEYVIHAVVPGTDNYTGLTLDEEFQIYKRTLNETNVEPIPAQVYTGSAITPVIVAKFGDITLTKGVDYTVTYENNTEAGTATAKVSFIGNYAGSADKTFTIEPKKAISVEITDTYFVYDGTTQTPTIIVRDVSRDTALVLDTDYTVSYRLAGTTTTATPADVAKYEAVINGIGNYAGLVGTAEFEIVKVDNSIVFDEAERTFVYEKDKVENANNYTAPFAGTASYESTDTSVVSVDAASGKLTIKGVGTAFIKLTLAGDANHESITTYYKVTVTPKSIAALDATGIADKIYTASPISILAGLMDGTLVLTEGTDFIVSITDNIVKGTATVTYTGCGNYKDTLTKTFAIGAKTLDSANIEAIPDQLFTGSAVTPKLTVKDGAITLTEGVDYTVTYSDNSAVGTATANVTYIGNYAGTGSATFKIGTKSGLSVEIKNNYFVYDGTTKTPAIVVKDIARDEVLVAGTDYTVSYRLAGTATDATPADVATYELVVEGIGNYSGKAASAEFEIVKAKTTASFASDELSFVYDADKAIDANAYTSSFAGSASFESTDPSVVSVDAASGKLTVKKVGTAFIRLTVAGDENHEGTTISYKVSVTPKSISGLEATGIEDKIYTAAPITLAAGLKDGELVLVEGTDFTVSYSNNIAKGTATVVYKGCGNYTDTLTKTFEIGAKKLDSSAISAIPSVEYNGSAITPVTVVRDGIITLTEGTDYNVTYSDNVNVGTAKIAVEFIGNYTGNGGAEFEIKAKENGIDLDLSTNTFTYDGTEQTPDITVKDGGTTLVEGTDYVIVYRDSEGTVVDHPSSSGIYTVEIEGQGNYSGTLSETAFIIGVYPTVATFDADSVIKTYGDEAFVNALTIALADDHGAVSFTSSDTSVATVDAEGKVTIISAGTAVITAYVAATENTSAAYAVFTLTVNAKDASGFEIGLDGDFGYTGSPINPVVTIKDGEKVLVEGVDYVVTVTDNIAAGTATVTVVYMGDYEGNGTETFEITPKTLDSSAIADIDPQTYTGEEIKPKLDIKDGDKTLTEGVDYTVVYVDNTDVGTATATVTFIGDYTGTLEKTFEIVAKENGITTELELNDTPYTGSDIEVHTIVKDGEKVLVEGTDYTVVIRDSEGNEVTNPKEAGAYTVEIIGEGNYSGTIGSRTFIVTPYVTTAEFTDSSAIKAFGDEDFTNALIIDRDDEHGAVTYRSSDANVAVVDENGKVTIIGIGTAVITADVAATDNTTCATASFTLTVGTKSGSGNSITISGNLIYTGKPVVPGLLIKDGDKTLTEGVDYTVTYVNNTNAGTATAKITYIGNYSGTTDIKYTITPVANRMTVTLGKLSFVFNGKSQVPEVTVKDGSTKLTLNKDYTIGYYDVVGNAVSAPVNAGAYVVKVTGKGNYNGSVVSAAYEITPAEVTAKFASEKIEKIIDDAVFTNALTITPLTDGKLVYTSSDPSVAYVDQNGKVTVVAHGNVTITVYVAATNNYKAAVASYTVSVSGKDIGKFAVETIGTKIYTGEELTPRVVIRDGSKLLLEGRDYTVSYADNKEIGTAKVSVTGIGDYSGTNGTSFAIVANTNVFEIAPIDTVIFEGKEVSPKPEVRYAGKTLVEGVDYDVTYVNNDKTGVATVVITGKGPYEGLSGTQNYNINSSNVSSIDDDGNCEYLTIVSNNRGFGGGLRIEVERVDSNQKKLPLDSKFVEASTSTRAYSEEQLRGLVRGTKRLLNLKIKLMAGNTEVTDYEGTYTVKILVPAELAGAKAVQIAHWNENGEAEMFETKVENGYIVFDTEEFGEFMFIGKTSWISWWWIVVLCCIICATTIVICVVISKKKDDEDKDQNDGENGDTPDGEEADAENAEAESADENKENVNA